MPRPSIGYRYRKAFELSELISLIGIIHLQARATLIYKSYGVCTVSHKKKKIQLEYGRPMQP